MSDRPVPAPGRAWWAPRGGRMTRRAAASTVALVGSLALVTGLVWSTPAVESLRGVAEAAEAPSAEELRLARENAAMRDELQSSRAQAGSLREALDKEQAARLKGEEERAAAQAAEEAAAGSTTAKKSTVSSGRSPGRTGSSGSANPSNPTQPAGPAAPVTTKPTAPSKGELLDPAQRYFGMYTAQAPFSWSTLDDAAAKVARTPSLVGWFSGWDKPFRSDAVVRSWERGMLPMLTWESRPSTSGNDIIVEPDHTLPIIIGDPAAGVPGRYDDYLRQYARDIAALGLPMAIRLDHEMNGIWYPWAERTGSGDPINGNRPGDFVAMWRHVHDIFEAEGANEHVIWVWSPNIVNNLPAALQTQQNLAGLYPGDAYVDWVGVSGYYRPPYKVENNHTFQYTYDRTLNQVRALTDKPILLSEVGASEIGGKKPTWVRSFFQGFTRPENADIIGFAWFNMAVSTYSEGQLITNDWRVDSRRNSLAEFVSGLNNPANGFGGTPLDAPAPDEGTDPEDSLIPTDDVAPLSVGPAPEPAASPSATPTTVATPTASPTPSPTTPATTAPTTPAAVTSRTEEPS